MHEPPVITIRNPAAPAESYDVIGTEPTCEPRRLTPRQRRLSLLAALIVATGCTGAWTAGHLRHEQDLAAASVRSVHLLTIPAAVASFRGDSTELGLGFLNLSDAPLTVRSVRYDAPGFPELRPRGGAVPLNDPTFLTFPLSSRSCPTSAPALSDEGAVVVALRTSRGRDTTLRLVDDGSVGLGSDYLSALGSLCHVYRPGDSVVADALPRVSRAGADLRLVWTVHNQSSAPRRLLGARVTGGLELVQPIAPVALDDQEGHRLEVRLRIASCRDAQQSWGFGLVQQGTTPAFQAVNADGALSLVVEGDGRVDDAGSFLLPGQLDDVEAWIGERCG